jgi:outer membrane protein assembly factor BamE
MFSNRTLRTLCTLIAAALFLPALGGCVYRMNIQQGNYLENSTLDQLQVGMTRSQVRYLLGTPMVPDAFDKDRWDYLYYLRKGRLEKPEQRHLIVYFENDKVARFERQTGTGAPSSSAENASDKKDVAAKTNDASASRTP